MLIYQLLIRLLLPIVVIYILLSSKKQQSYIRQRLGFGYKTPHKNTQNAIWIHCASVGEVKSVEQLVKQLVKNLVNNLVENQSKQQYILITTNTITGKELVDSLFDNNKVRHQYCPYDLPLFIQNFINSQQPTKLWVVETEIWTNLFRSCNKNDIPITILNGRLSKKTLNAPNWLKITYNKALSLVSKVITRNQQEADNFYDLGVAKDKISIIGNLKYAGLADIKPQKSKLNRPFVLLASSHAGEELAIAKIWQNLQRDELLVIVPRHPKRKQVIIDQLAEYREQLAVYSLKEPVKDSTKIYLIDAIGQLMPLFADAKLVIMGGSFVEKGGHNIIEPASVKAAIITGACMTDYKEETTLLKDVAGIQQVTNYQQLAQQLPKLLNDEKARKKLGNNAQQAVLSQQHILNDYLKELNQL